MYEHHSRFDYAALEQLPAEEALRRVCEYCSVLEARNAELSAALEESRLVLQSFVMSVLQRDGNLLEKTVSPDTPLRDFLRSHAASPVPASNREHNTVSVSEPAFKTVHAFSAALPESQPQYSAAEPDAELIVPAPEPIIPAPEPIMHTSEPIIPTPKVFLSSLFKPAAEPSLQDTAASSEKDGGRAAELTETAGAYNESPASETSADPETVPADRDTAELPAGLPDAHALPPAESISDTKQTEESSYTEWPDSPMITLSFGGVQSQKQRGSLLAWMRDPSQILSSDLFSQRQLKWLDRLLKGRWTKGPGCAEVSKYDDSFYASLNKQLEEHSAIWKQFSDYAHQLLRDWSVSIEIDMEEFDEPETYLNSAQPRITDQATAAVQADSDIASFLQPLNRHLYRIPSLSLVGCDQGSPLSAYSGDDKGQLILRSDWCSLTAPEKLCLVNWQLHSIVCRSANLLKTIKTIISLEDTVEDLGCTLIKRTASIAMSRAHRSIPADLIMAMSGIWGSEQLKELDDLLVRLHHTTDYQPFLCAREFIASPAPLQQIFDLSADSISLRLTEVKSASRSLIAQILGTDALAELNPDTWPTLLRRPHPSLAYLHRRLAGLWIASLPKG